MPKEKGIKIVEDIQRRLDASSQAEVIRKALFLLARIMDHIDAGDHILIEQAVDGKIVGLEFPLLIK